MPDQRLTELGTRLHRAREARGISLRHIADVTKISVRTLEAVERNDLSHLPGGIFTRAIVRAYAAEVGLDPEATLREFLSQGPAADESFGASDGEAAGTGSWTERLPLGAVLRVAAVVAVVAAVTYGLVRWYDDARRGPDSRAVADAAMMVPAESALATRAAVQHSGGTPERAPDPIAPAPPGTLTVVVSARGPCWVSARIDGRPPAEQMLAEGARLVLRAEQQVVLKVGDAGAVTLEINGRAARLLGGTGRVVTARIGADNLDDYFVGR
jgi:transcriptional regulator with XRE-family HTH domain